VRSIWKGGGRDQFSLLKLGFVSHRILSMCKEGSEDRGHTQLSEIGTFRTRTQHAATAGGSEDHRGGTGDIPSSPTCKLGVRIALSMQKDHGGEGGNRGTLTTS
jgi:hypothetical protein